MLLVVLVIVSALVLVRNLPLALGPLFAPPRQRRLARAAVPMVTVVLALVVLILAMKTLHAPLITTGR